MVCTTSENSVKSAGTSMDFKNSDNSDSKQNSIAEFEAANNMECDTSENTEKSNESLNVDDEDFLDNRTRIPRSASCPVPKTENNSSEEEGSSLSLSWSMLFESEDTGK